jgi:O-antigen ligase
MSEGRYLARFWQLLTLMWAVFGGMGILQRIFADRMTELDSLSLFFSQSPLVWVFLILSGAAAFVFTGTEGKITDGSKKKLQTGYRIFLAAVVVSLLAAVVFIYLNTRGYLLSWFGWQSTNSYLYFDILWGNMRGSTWILSWETYRQMPLLNQIFGVGPDSFASYMYSDPGRAEYLQQFWGGLTLSNAHNEYLNSLICYGAVGVTAWTGALVCGIRRFYRLAKKEPFFLAFALCTIGYACHNFFCYQQVCCTPFLFIFWGLGESRAALRGESLDKTEKIT